MRDISKEKVIGYANILIGVALLIFNILAIRQWTNLPNENYRMSLANALMIYHHGFITSIFIFGSGILLLLSRRLGWIIAVATSLACIINIGPVAFKMISEPYSDQGIALTSVFGLFFIAITIALLSKDLRTKYLTLQSAALTSIVIIVLLIDRFILS